jgi:hypothetical protein
MRNASGAMARNATQKTALLLPVSRRLHSIPDIEDTAADATVVTARPEMDEEIEFEELDLDGQINALMEVSNQNREILRGQLDSAVGRISSAEEELVRLRKSNLARRNEIIALQKRSKMVERDVSVHDLAFAELHRVILPAMNSSLTAAHDENRRLHYRLASLEAGQNIRQARLTVAHLAHPAPSALPSAPSPAPAKGWPVWLHYSAALILAATGIVLALSQLL